MIISSEKELSCGVDIEEISRFSKIDIDKNKFFFEKVFTRNEMDYCFSKKNPAQHLAVRFAGKEAIIKAIARFKKNPPFFNQIEILNNAEGLPIVNINNFEVKVSLSHCKDKAIAFAIIKGA